MRHFITILLVALVACSCSSPQHKISLEPGRIISYATPYTGWGSAATRFTLADGQEAIAFFNTETYKRMDVFTLDGKPVKTIPLKELTAITHIEDIVALNRDSFLALGAYHNNIYLFNSDGKVLKETHINDTVQGYDNWYVELTTNKCDGFIQDDSTLLLHCDYRERNYDKTRSQSDIRLIWHKINYTLPYFLSIRDAFSPKPQLHYALPGFYHRFLSDSFYCMESDHYVFTPQNILLTSHYNDSLYVVNKKTYNIDQAIKIQSAYTKIGHVVPNDSADVLNDIIQTGGSISDAYYDQYRKLYYVVLRHAINRNAGNLERRNHRKWSILVYDKDFNPLDEINMDPKFAPGDIIITREGIMCAFFDYEQSNVPTKFQLFYVHQK